MTQSPPLRRCAHQNASQWLQFLSLIQLFECLETWDHEIQPGTVPFVKARAWIQCPGLPGTEILLSALFLTFILAEDIHPGCTRGIMSLMLEDEELSHCPWGSLNANEDRFTLNVSEVFRERKRDGYRGAEVPTIVAA
ncbi:hypothetical protein Efla_000626 [Eimeria flavescens]